MQRLLRIGLTTLAASTVLCGCSALREASAPGKDAARAFHVVGYLPDGSMADFDPAMARYVTDVIYFALEPEPSGALHLARVKPEHFAKLDAMRAAHGVRVLVGVGGWGRCKGFPPMATDAAARKRFVENLTRWCVENGFDGADYDWEFPTRAAEGDAYADLIVETGRAFRPHGMMVTVAVGAWQKLRPRAYRWLDRVHLMSYDRGVRHSTFDRAQDDIGWILKRGVAPEKVCLGVPFYGRKVKNPKEAMVYKDLVAAHHPGPDVDEVGGFYFNGMDTIQRKTRLARERGLGGVMIWQIGYDTSDETSLLEAIDAVASGY